MDDMLRNQNIYWSIRSFWGPVKEKNKLHLPYINICILNIHTVYFFWKHYGLTIKNEFACSYILEEQRIVCCLLISFWHNRGYHIFLLKFQEESLVDDSLLQDDDEEEEDNESRSWRRWFNSSMTMLELHLCCISIT